MCTVGAQQTTIKHFFLLKYAFLLFKFWLLTFYAASRSCAALVRVIMQPTVLGTYSYHQFLSHIYSCRLPTSKWRFLPFCFFRAPVFRIHYLMFAMVFVKACSLAFHAINFYVIGKHGVPEEGWAVMYYISHMTRGFLLFVTILMIGAGWTFIKHAFSRREKHLFAIIIPLQVLANVATIVMEESEQGASRYLTWKEIFTVVDLVCCVLILFPVIWSIRHLQAAAQSDGKAAQNLRKLRLFRHFYIMVICYIYFTRIIVYLLKLTIPAHLNWLVELFQELVTLVFLFSIGYKFRPFNDNPYLQVPSDEDEDTLLERFDLEEVYVLSPFYPPSGLLTIIQL
ncbi:unnamed protein product [Schistocephalus solidus]|uniref:Lung seven transmembrane receptor family protein n=1 Tax=Schistocephalus solidus TaxID=70667 RepID=A0A183T215_SCHSO|nr:unnamed protein product [Schistocephalus solidus]